MADDNPRPLDRGPGTVEDDAPQTARGMWRLMQIPGIDPARAVAIAERHYSWATLERATEAQLMRIVGRTIAAHIITNGIPTHGLPDAGDADVMTPWDPRYPNRVRETPGAPPLLWVRGSIPDGPVLAVGGAATVSTLAQAVVVRAVRTACAAGVATTATLTGGVGELVASTTLEAGGRHVAVLGSGCDDVVERVLADRVVAGGGAVVTEVPPGVAESVAGVSASTRIVAALGAAVLLGSGTSLSDAGHLARFALVQQRPLWVPAVPRGHEGDATAALTIALADPDGLTDPVAIGASGRLAGRLSNRRPCADRVLADGETLDAAVRSLA